METRLHEERKARKKLPKDMKEVKKVLYPNKTPSPLGSEERESNPPKPFRRTEDGDQREVNGSQSKFLQWNLAYIPKSTRTLSLVTRPRPPSYRQAIGLRNWVMNCNIDSKRC
jgi:hypothetical protein